MIKIGCSFALITLCLGWSCTKASPSLRPPPTVDVISASTCLVPFYLDYVGHVEANVTVDVRAQVSGIVVAKHFTEGVDVKQGEPLLTIDPRPYMAKLASAKASLSQSKASLTYAQEKVERYAGLLKQEFVSQLDYDQYATSALEAEAIVAQHQASLWDAKIQLDYCYITAPVDSTTGLLRVKVGNYVDAGADTVLTTLTQIQPILVNFSVPEDDLFLLQQAQKIQPIALEVFVDKEKTQACSGVLTLINNQVQMSTGALLCQGTFNNEEKLLWPGHFVAIRATLGEPKEEIVLPTGAIQIGMDGHYVYTLGEGQAIVLTPVLIGQRQGDFTVIKEGIQKNDLVVTSGQLNLYPGLKVAPTMQLPGST